MVCRPCLDIQNPQEYARIPRVERAIPWSRPEPADILLDENIDCSLMFAVPISTPISADLTIIKGVTIGPAIIDDGVTVTVTCEWSIR